MQCRLQASTHGSQRRPNTAVPCCLQVFISRSPIYIIFALQLNCFMEQRTQLAQGIFFFSKDSSISKPDIFTEIILFTHVLVNAGVDTRSSLMWGSSRVHAESVRIVLLQHFPFGDAPPPPELCVCNAECAAWGGECILL